MDRPNILFVFADQLRGCSLGHVGQESVFTPNLDRFAEQGVRLTRAVANCPLCSPMRASLLTGQHPLTHGVLSNDIQLPTDAPSVAKSLKQIGYRTGYIGKWHVDIADRGVFIPPGPRRAGFDDFWAVANCNHNYFEAFYYRDDPDPIWIGDYEPNHQTDLAIEFLRKSAGSGGPFCLFLSWGPPHCPYEQVPTRFRDLYEPERLKPRANAPNADRRVTAGYCAHISALDWNFGRLMEAVDSLGLAGNTLVVFTSDHGDMLFSHDRGWKSKPYHESVIVPFIARLPGVIPAGRVETAPFGLVNTTPTLLAFCGASIPAEVEGEALPYLLTGEPGPRPVSTPIYHYVLAVPSRDGVWRGVVTEHHTYARFAEEPWVLFDDQADPYQFENLACEERAAGLREQMESELQAWLEQLADSFETHEQLIERYGIETNERGTPRYYFEPEMLREMQRRAEGREERMRLA